MYYRAVNISLLTIFKLIILHLGLLVGCLANTIWRCVTHLLVLMLTILWAEKWVFKFLIISPTCDTRLLWLRREGTLLESFSTKRTVKLRQCNFLVGRDLEEVWCFRASSHFAECRLTFAILELDLELLIYLLLNLLSLDALALLLDGKHLCPQIL